MLKAIFFLPSFIISLLLLTGCSPEAEIVCYESTNTNCKCFPKNVYKTCRPEWADGYVVCEHRYNSCPE